MVGGGVNRWAWNEGQKVANVRLKAERSLTRTAKCLSPAFLLRRALLIVFSVRIRHGVVVFPLVRQ